MASLSDLKRSWLLKMMGLSSSALSEADLAALLYSDTSFNSGVRRVKTPAIRASNYFYPISGGSNGTSSGLGNGNARHSPWIVEETIRIVRIGAEITTVGEAGSKLRLGIYDDSGTGLPANLLLDAGQINGDSATVQELTCDITLSPGIYWLVGAVQAAPTSQPTVRTHTVTTPDIICSSGSIPTTGLNMIGYSHSGVSGALPASFVSAGIVGLAPRIFLRTA